MSVGEFCNREVVIASKDSSLVNLAQLMRQHHVGSIVIVEREGSNNIPIGIITDRDIVVEVLAQQSDLDTVTAGDIMNRELVTARDVDGLWETLKRMRSHGIRRVPVVNDEQVLLGILSADDVLEILANEFTELVALMKKEHHKEVAVRTVP